MSITITLPGELEIESYSGLKDFLADHLELADSVIEQLPTLIRLAEARLARLLTTPLGETSTVLATVAGSQTVALPSDFENARQLKINGDTGGVLDLTAPDMVEVYKHSGQPIMWATHGPNILLGPIPDAVYSLTLRYQGSLAFLTDNAASNWLLVEHPDAYVYMSSAVISQHVGNPEMARLYLAMTEAVVDEINRQGNRRRRTTPARLRSPVVV